MARPAAMISLVVLLAAVFVANAEVEAPSFVVVHKAIPTTPIKASQDVPVTITVYNMGKSPIYQVALTDATPSEEQWSLEGSLTATWETVNSGESVTHAYTLRPKFSGNYTLSPATVTYRLPSKATVETSVSSVPKLTRIYADTEKIEVEEDNSIDWIHFVKVVGGASAIPAVLIFLASQADKKKKTSSVSGRKKK
eukprot:jgi/Mesvir1/3737/Mv15013-RA.1